MPLDTVQSLDYGLSAFPKRLLCNGFRLCFLFSIIFSSGFPNGKKSSMKRLHWVVLMVGCFVFLVFSSPLVFLVSYFLFSILMLKLEAQ